MCASLCLYGYGRELMRSTVAQHHPEWSNTWNEVKISLTTHDHGNVVSQLDVHMAKQIDRIASEFLTSQDEED